ncbi:MAG: SUF system NifU family Fe-S cluster assembly protein [Dehalococcoidia bacterium]|nr:SUF system NifU family Fe-S cluster assembly protein [Dehalococcoidia bacterium]
MALGNLDEIYRDDVILDHRRNPRNPDRIDDADILMDGVNPFCGDEIHLQIKLGPSGRVVKVGFQGEGCSINQATGSMLSEAVKGLTLSEAAALSDQFHEVMEGAEPSQEQLAGLGDLSALAKVRDFPVRIKCALLAWSTLEDGLG